MSWNNKVKSALESQRAVYKKLFALEVNKTQWLETGELFQATQAQQASDALMAELVPVDELIVRVDASIKDPVLVVRSDKVLGSLYDDLKGAVDKLHTLSVRNQKLLQSQMKDVLKKINEMRHGRKALKGYHSQTKAAPQHLDGNL